MSDLWKPLDTNGYVCLVETSPFGGHSLIATKHPGKLRQLWEEQDRAYAGIFVPAIHKHIVQLVYSQDAPLLQKQLATLFSAYRSRHYAIQFDLPAIAIRFFEFLASGRAGRL